MHQGLPGDQEKSGEGRLAPSTIPERFKLDICPVVCVANRTLSTLFIAEEAAAEALFP